MWVSCWVFGMVLEVWNMFDVGAGSLMKLRAVFYLFLIIVRDETWEIWVSFCFWLFYNQWFWLYFAGLVVLVVNLSNKVVFLSWNIAVFCIFWIKSFHFIHTISTVQQHPIEWPIRFTHNLKSMLSVFVR